MEYFTAGTDHQSAGKILKVFPLKIKTKSIILLIWLCEILKPDKLIDIKTLLSYKTKLPASRPGVSISRILRFVIHIASCKLTVSFGTRYNRAPAGGYKKDDC
ncbi:hypothetical protein DMA11_11775 [Marinilabiliaceae bacterium JC017]|nr:hypothetical protein DMA11_11775 [Marinilabiliaceae bacterium JC017]